MPKKITQTFKEQLVSSHPTHTRKNFFVGRPLKKGGEIEAVAEMANKYFDLVWYARSRPIEDKEYWDKTPEKIRNTAFEAREKVEKKYPNEVARLKEEVKVGEVVFSSPDWEHGFNSGVLAAMRFVLTAFDDTTETCEETGEELCFGGVENARDTFPELDT